jgi:hypothetical protein
VSQAPDDLERLLRRARPAPREEFLRELERSLPRQRTRREPRPIRLVAAGWGFATVLAVVALGLSLAGLLPFTSSGSPARADRDCKTVMVERDQRVPYFVHDHDGLVQVRYRVERTPQLVRRCR